MIKGIIFDYDGVIGDTLITNYKIVNTLLERHGLEKFKTLEDFRNHGITNWKEKMPELGFTEKDLKEIPDMFMEEARKRSDEFKLFEGIEKMLRKLRPRFKFGIVSNGHSERIQEKLKKEDMLGLFDCIIGFEDVGKMKPDPHQIIACMERMSMIPGETCFVGDTEVDVQAGKNAHVAKIIAVTYGYQIEELLGDADVIVHSPEELLRTLEGFR